MGTSQVIDDVNHKEEPFMSLGDGLKIMGNSL